MNDMVSKKEISLFNIVERLKKTPPIVVGALLLILLSSLGTFYEDGSLAIYLFNRTFRYKAVLINDLEKLSAGVDVGYFNQLLGNPVFVNRDERKEFKEYVYVNKYYYVQALTDIEGQVLSYAVTTRHREFNPVFNLPGDNQIVLGKTHFAALECPEQLGSYVFVHDFYYFEPYYFGNPGNYQTYILALNQSGYAGIEDEEEPAFQLPPDRPIESPRSYGEILEEAKQTGDFDKPIVEPSRYCNDQEIISFREKAIINTVAITAPSIELTDLESIDFFSDSARFGPSYNQVRILPRNRL